MDKSSNQLFERVSRILEQAKANVVYSVNHNTVLANWLIGREIVLELQQGEGRAEYGTQLLENLSKQLNQAYASGYSVTNLKYFRIFYQVYADRITESNRHPLGDQSDLTEKRHPAGDESSDLILAPSVREIQTAFSPRLSWSHYRALMQVKDPKAREFYEKEAGEGG